MPIIRPGFSGLLTLSPWPSHCVEEPEDPFANAYVKPSLTLDEYLDLVRPSSKEHSNSFRVLVLNG